MEWLCMIGPHLFMPGDNCHGVLVVGLGLQVMTYCTQDSLVSPLPQVYFANVHPKFPEGGKMSQYLNSLSIGDTVDIRGPAGKVVYLGRGYFRVKDPGKPEEIRFATDVGLIAGGTGKRLWGFSLSLVAIDG